MDRKGFAPPGFVIILAVITILIGGVWCWYFSKTLSGSNSPSATIPRSPVALEQLFLSRAEQASSLQISTSSTTGWKSYSDTQYGFAFKYPPTFRMDSKSENGTVDFVDNSNLRLTIQPLLFLSPNQCLFSTSSGERASQTVVDGKSYSYTEDGGGGNLTTYQDEIYRTYNNSICYLIWLNETEPKISPDYPRVSFHSDAEIAKAIVETFSFTPSLPSASSPSQITWNRYNDTVTGISFLYRSDYIKSASLLDGGSFWVQFDHASGTISTLFGLPESNLVTVMSFKYFPDSSSSIAAIKKIYTNATSYDRLRIADTTLGGQYALLIQKLDPQQIAILPSEQDIYYVPHNGLIYEVDVDPSQTDQYQSLLSSFKFTK